MMVRLGQVVAVLGLILSLSIMCSVLPPITPESGLGTETRGPEVKHAQVGCFCRGRSWWA